MENEFVAMSDDEVRQFLQDKRFNPNHFRKLDDGEWILPKLV